jgi:transcription elongation factor GreA
MAETGMTVAEAIHEYLSSLSEGDRAAQQADLQRFLRWLPSDARLDRLRGEEIERYQEQIERSGADQTRLEPVRTFLTGAHKRHWTEFNFGKLIKLKRASKSTARKPLTTRLSDYSASANAQPSAANGDEIAQITPEGYDELKKELEYLTTEKRAEIAHALAEARIDKDFRENAPFDAAKQHQAEVETRINYLQRIIATAQIVDPRQNGGRIGIGASIVLRDLTHDEEEVSYTLVGTSEANPRAGKISIASPVGRALIDRRVGETVEVEAPQGVILYRVERIES